MESPIYCHVPVHFAATEEALSLYFAKCGVVENGVILTDKTTGQRKGSAYVAFASKDSAVKAVALSGATFFSRTLKVPVPWWVRVCVCVSPYLQLDAEKQTKAHKL